ncbi:TPA: EAL domain-containing protein, partial [Escherichia coli]|nr:EAL domain-containing protein [Escherichia coli]HDL9645009.1 EAL domain-containing protein [Escherichia coli]
MEVVAEGVETPDCLAWLRQAGCDTVQGALLQIVGGDKLI